MEPSRIVGGVAVLFAATALWVIAPKAEARQQRMARSLPQPIRRIAAPTFHGRPFLARLIAVFWAVMAVALIASAFVDR